MTTETASHTATCEQPGGDREDCAAAWLWAEYMRRYPSGDLDELSDAVRDGCGCACHGEETEA